MTTTHVGMLLFPGLTQLDLAGPFEVLHRVPDTRVHLVWKTLDGVAATSGYTTLPTVTFESCPKLDVLFVPGGHGLLNIIHDPQVRGFLRDQAAGARYVTSVCTGALMLGAAGLLKGYDATTHWAYTEVLPLYGARPVPGRVVIDRNRITGGGVTAGIDFGLVLAARLAGEAAAKTIQLGLEYDPKPPFDSGHPDVAEPGIVAVARARLADAVAAQTRAAGQSGIVE